MKIISLNTWGGKVYEPQVEFLKFHAKDTDIFCFQEVYNGSERLSPASDAVTDMFSEYQRILSDFNGIHAESWKIDTEGVAVPYGIAMFCRKSLEMKESGCYEIFKQDEKVELEPGLIAWNRLLQYITLPYKDTQVTIFNLHGMFTGGGKGDCNVRFLQSERIKSFMDQHQGEKVLCGDFNLNPETKSLSLLAEGMRDLIKENGITSTRSHYYTKERKFADYMLVSPGVDVKKFEVLADVVSDHLPLMVEI